MTIEQDQAHSPAFLSVKEAVETAIKNKQVAEAMKLLAPFVNGDANVSERDRLWTHRVYGWALYKSGEVDAGIAHLERAYRLEPRDLKVCEIYSHMLFKGGQLEPAVRVMRNLIVHHKAALPGSLLASIYRAIAEFHVGKGEPLAALRAFDQSLAADPSDGAALESALRTIAGLDDKQQAIRSRKVLLRRLPEPAQRAAVLHGLGGDLEHIGDLDGALQAYEEALEVAPTWVPLLKSKASLLGKLNRGEEAAQMLVRLATLREGPSHEERIAYLEQAAGHLHDVPSAIKARIEVLEAMLSLQPERLDLFEQLTRASAAAEDWSGLAARYKKMIALQQELGTAESTRALPVLWRNLAEVYHLHLGRPKDAYEALSVACRLRPKDIELRRKALDLCRNREDLTLEAVQLARELVALDPDDDANKKEYAQALLMSGRYDEALCLLQVLHVEGNESLERHLERLQRKTLKLPERPLSENDRRQHLRSSGQSRVLDSMMAIAGSAYRRLFAHDLHSLGLSERERLDPRQGLMFTTQYADIGQLLGFTDLPRVYKNPKINGIANAVLDRPAFMVGPDMLSGRGERELAFLIAQQLTLVMRPEYTLTTVMQPMHLKLVLLVLTHKVDKKIPLPPNPEVPRLRREADKRVKGDLLRRLKKVVKSMVSGRLDADVDAWVEAVADEANRTGLVFCGDVGVADQCIDFSPGVLGSPHTADRTLRLHRWATSDDYFSLRYDLGLSISE